jgi:hypothetical protein
MLKIKSMGGSGKITLAAALAVTQPNVFHSRYLGRIADFHVFCSNADPGGRPGESTVEQEPM